MKLHCDVKQFQWMTASLKNETNNFKESYKMHEFFEFLVNAYKVNKS